MNQSLVWVADKLRTNYGDALMAILRMLLMANQVYPVKVRDNYYERAALLKPDAVKINLKWPSWYQPTAADHANKATAIKTNRDAGARAQSALWKL